MLLKILCLYAAGRTDTMWVGAGNAWVMWVSGLMYVDTTVGFVPGQQYFGFNVLA